MNTITKDLCESCEGVSDWYTPILKSATRPEPSDPRCRFLHRLSYEELEASAKAGCKLCDLVCYDISLFSSRELRRRTKIAIWKSLSHDVESCLKSWTGSTRLEFTCMNGDGHFSTFGLMYHLGDSGVSGTLPFGHIFPFDNLSRYPEARFNLAWKWLDQCDKGHPDCACPDASYVPSRLLDVGEEHADAHLRLVDTTKETVGLLDSRYVALSYCWGLSMPSNTVTKTSNIQSHLNGLAVQELPSTLRDAVQITRALSIRYLWIDALCIIQDDSNDWQLESAAMSKIYSNAYCTIASAATSHCGGGMLVNQDRRQLLSVRFDDFSLKASMPDHRDLRDSSPLSRRAWALQERELSSRILWFTRHMLTFECRKMWASEEERRGQDHPFDSSGIRDRSLNILSATWLGKSEIQPLHTNEFTVASNHEHNSDALGDMYLAWRGIIEKYSDRELTRASDKLPALSGLAHVVQACVNSDYAAGIWVNDLLRGLLWRRTLQLPRQVNRAFSSQETSTIVPHFRRVVTGILSTINTPKDFIVSPTPAVNRVALKQRAYIAPSWSWASTDEHLDYRTAIHSRRNDPAGPSNSLNAQLISVNVTPAGADPMGEILAGRIVLVAWVRSLRDWLSTSREPWFEEMIRWDSDNTDKEGVMIMALLRDDPFYEDVAAYNGLLIKETGNTGEFKRVGLVKTVHASWLGIVQKKTIILV